MHDEEKIPLWKPLVVESDAQTRISTVIDVSPSLDGNAQNVCTIQSRQFRTEIMQWSGASLIWNMNLSILVSQQRNNTPLVFQAIFREQLYLVGLDIQAKCRTVLPLESFALTSVPVFA